VLEASGDVGDDDEGSTLVDDASLESKPGSTQTPWIHPESKIRSEIAIDTRSADPCEVPEVAELLELGPVVPDGDAPRLSILWCWPAWPRDKNREWAHGFPVAPIVLLPRVASSKIRRTASRQLGPYSH
jgi:hypothetical protein